MAINYDTAPSGGIDQQVQDKADTYRKNPQGLFGKYRASGNLIELIALQRLNEERKAKQQEIAMQMEPNPQSVAEQEYEEAKGLIKNDIVNQTGKLLEEKQKRAAMNQQRMMGNKPPAGVPAAARRRPPTNMAGIGGIPTRAPVNPRGTGIAANPVPSSPTAYGAGGGIVSFQNTGLVTGKPHQNISAAALKKLGYSLPEWSKLSAGEQQQVIEVYRAFEAGELGDMDPAKIREIYSYEGQPFQRMEGIQQVDEHGFPNKNTQPVDPFGGTTGTGRDPYPDVDILPPEAKAVEEAPEDGQSTFEAVENIERDPLTANMIPKGTGQVDTTGIPGQYNWTDLTLPSQTDEGKKLAANREQLLAQQAGVLNNEEDARATAAAWADEQTGKAGIADANTRMLQERKDMIAAGDRARVGSGLYDLLARAGGRGALANIGRAAADKRYQDLLRDERQLMGTQELERYGLEQLRMAGDTAVQAGMKAEELSSAEKRTAATQMAEILRQQGDDLTEEAKLVLRQESDKMSEHAANRRDTITVATENASAELKAAINNLNGELTIQTNEIRRDAVDSDNLRTVQMGITEAAKNIGLIKAKVSADFAKVIQNDPTYMQLNIADKDEGTNKAEAYLKKQRIIWDTMADNLVSELEEIQRQGYQNYNILMEKISPTGGVQVTGIAGQT